MKREEDLHGNRRKGRCRNRIQEETEKVPRGVPSQLKRRETWTDARPCLLGENGSRRLKASAGIPRERGGTHPRRNAVLPSSLSSRTESRQSCSASQPSPSSSRTP